MTAGPKKPNRFRRKLLYKYRLVILNQDTFEEHFSFRLNRLNVFVFGTLFALLLIIMTTVLIAFTPLREYVPGYSSAKLTKQAVYLEQKVDSLEIALDKNDRFLLSIQRAIKGEIDEISYEDIQIKPTLVDKQALSQKPSSIDSILRNRVSQEDKYNPLITNIDVNLILHTPVQGHISNSFSVENKHYAVDIITEANAAVKAAADGTVIFSEWSVDTGNVIIIKHTNDLVTVYKHNQSLVKTQGDLVKSGEVIATVGNSGALTTGPHLHFEVWYDGYPMNPENFVEF